MAKANKSKTKWIWLSVRVLLVCVVATTIAYASRLNMFLLDDVGAISLISETALEVSDSSAELEDKQASADSSEFISSADEVTAEEPASSTDSSIVTEEVLSEEPVDSAVSETSQGSQQNFKPGFSVSDDNTVWATNTPIEIFRVSYENGEQVITVNSDNGDKVIAPGTENSYTFKLKNTGNVALDYTVELEAFFTPAEIEIPVTGRLNRYDGEWIVGSQDEFVKVPVLDTAEDEGTLGAGKYTYYTLDWVWPFESGDDEYDTYLGNLATEQDLTFTVVIKTTATASFDPDDDSGITPPQTGDNFNLTTWLIIAATSLIIMLVLIFSKDNEKEQSTAEAE